MVNLDLSRLIPFICVYSVIGPSFHSPALALLSSPARAWLEAQIDIFSLPANFRLPLAAGFPSSNTRFSPSHAVLLKRRNERSSYYKQSALLGEAPLSPPFVRGGAVGEYPP